MDVSYKGLLRKLLPPGLAFGAGAGSNLDALLDGLADEPARVHDRGEDLRLEAFPDTAVEMLSEWETVWGLPDQCTGALSTLAERRATLLAKMVHVGQQTPGFFGRVAATLGYTIVVEENVDGNPYVWRIVSNIITAPVYARAGSARAGDPIRTWGGDMLECAMRALNPAHLEVLFGYIEADIDPALASATIWANGTTIALVFNQALSHGAGYSDADFNVDASLAGADIGMTYVSGAGTATHIYTLGVQIRGVETVTIDFSGGSTSLVRGDGAFLADISGQIVTNNSVQTEAPPSIVSATVDSSGSTLTVVFSEAMSQGAAYQNSDFNLDASSGGADIGLTYVSGDGSDTWIYSISAVIRKDDTVDLDCYGRADGVVDTAGNAIQAVTDMAVVNGSQEDYSDIVLWSGLDGVVAGLVYTATPDDYPPSHTADVVGSPVLHTTTKRVGWSSLHRPVGINGFVFDIPENVPLRIGVWHYTTTAYAQHPFWLRSSVQATIDLRFTIYYGTRLRLQSYLIPKPVEYTENFAANTWRFFEFVFDPANRKIVILINGVVKIDYTHSSEFPTTNPINRLYLSEYNTNGPVDFNDNLIVSTDITRDLYAIALFETCPRV